MLKNPLFRRVVKNSSYLFSATGISAALGMLQGILVARLLGVDGYGVVGVITLFTGTVNNLISFRMGELVIKYVGEYTESGDEQQAAAVFKLAALVEMGASAVAFALLVLLAPLAARYLAKDAALTQLFVLYGLVVLANLIAESSTGLLQIFDRFRPIAILGLVGNIVTLALIALVFWLRGGLAGILLADLAGKVVSELGLSLAALME